MPLDKRKEKKRKAEKKLSSRNLSFSYSICVCWRLRCPPALWCQWCLLLLLLLCVQIIYNIKHMAPIFPSYSDEWIWQKVDRERRPEMKRKENRNVCAGSAVCSLHAIHELFSSSVFRSVLSFGPVWRMRVERSLLQNGECLIWRWEFAHIALKLNRVQIHMHLTILRHTPRTSSIHTHRHTRTRCTRVQLRVRVTPANDNNNNNNVINVRHYRHTWHDVIWYFVSNGMWNHL